MYLWLTPLLYDDTNTILQRNFTSVERNFKLWKNKNKNLDPYSKPRMWDWSTSGFPVLHNLLEFAQLMSTELMMSSNHLILCHPLLLFPPIPPRIRVISNELALHIRGRKYWSLAFVLLMHIQGWFPLGLTDLISLQSKRLSRVFSNTIVQKHQLLGTQPSLWSNSHIHTWLLEKP